MRPTLFSFLLFLTFALSMSGATEDYSRLESKAGRFFDNQEWASANAMYVLMLEEQPQNADTYAKAVVVNIMDGEDETALDILPRAMAYEVPLDTLLSEVRSTSFSIGRGDLYENYLLSIKQKYPWLSRIADNYLMQYYSFRHNGPELVRYAETMLSGLPDNLNFLRMLAYGNLLSGDTSAAEKVWLKVAELYPDNYATVLDLANLYDSTGQSTEALKWMRKAATFRRTPYVTERIAALSKQLP